MSRSSSLPSYPKEPLIRHRICYFSFGEFVGEMSVSIEKIRHHLVGHCDCCGGYRALKYQDQEIGELCVECAHHSAIADIELNFGGYHLRRPQSCRCCH